MKTNIISLTFTLLLPYTSKHRDVCVQVAQVPGHVSRGSEQDFCNEKEDKGYCPENICCISWVLRLMTMCLVWTILSPPLLGADSSCNLLPAHPLPPLLVIRIYPRPLTPGSHVPGSCTSSQVLGSAGPLNPGVISTCPSFSCCSAIAPISPPFVSIFIFLLRFCNRWHHWCYGTICREVVPGQLTHLGHATLRCSGIHTA